ncbi:zinc/manganese/iron ABC transporter, permease protein [Pseudooceanicola batsensis HTCC2597]|uniref:Zinc/manganese/iron ABC transporter, permease protein n=1 Tax=Pseudooceanicola batsensis (strain ATCC BAA-863 / DSM 15984 / KCTC 12145 / HTCC2597) TaxID=252305 RepID=A3TYE4_PSEBH|nr:metal ABC transporter permease [Pseudooceanicola batsensis]EAQ03178.1 zinc/manganese/iron ABC transporter, permease protein [Pseudooceanicola batsensis HTCC2597]
MIDIGYNATLVAIGAGLLGIAAGVIGAFLYLRKRSLVSDAISHATLPGVALAFLVMVALGGDGRNLVALLAGAALSALAGLGVVHWLNQRTRLGEDAAIGAVLSVFFGFGVVLLTVIQTIGAGRQAGLETFLLGSTAGMLRADAWVIAAGGALSLLACTILRRPMTMVSFDPEYAATQGLNPARVDMAMMALALAVTVVGLKIVGLILIVALLILPAVAARFWTERSEVVALLAGLFGGVSGTAGAVISSLAPDLPTGPIIVLVAAAVFIASLLLAPQRGVMAGALEWLRFRHRVHMRQGLLALAHGHTVYEPYTMRLLRGAGLIRADGVATEKGRAHAARAALDERRWQHLRSRSENAALAARYDGLTPVETWLTPDQIATLDREMTGSGGAA